MCVALSAERPPRARPPPARSCARCRWGSPGSRTRRRRRRTCSSRSRRSPSTTSSLRSPMAAVPTQCEFVRARAHPGQAGRVVRRRRLVDDVHGAVQRRRVREARDEVDALEQHGRVAVFDPGRVRPTKLSGHRGGWYHVGSWGPSGSAAGRTGPTRSARSSGALAVAKPP